MKLLSNRVAIFNGGVQKAGTSSLHAHLSEHPALAPPRVKELHFFDKETVDWAAPDYSVLENRFEARSPEGLRFESTPSYIFWPHAIARISAYNPSAKLIFLFRDPFDRAWSQWCMQNVLGTEPLPFAAALREESARLARLPPLVHKLLVFSYVSRGMYAQQVRRVLAFFPREQVLFLSSDDFHRDHVATLSRISTFLDIETFVDTGAKRVRPRTYTGTRSLPTDADRAFVADIVREEMVEFSALTGIDVSGWTVMKGPT